MTSHTAIAQEHAQEAAEAQRAGDLPQALGNYLMALALAPDHLPYRRDALDLLGVMGNVFVPSKLRPVLVACAHDDRLDTQALAMVIHNEYHRSETLTVFAQGSDADPEAMGEAITRLFTDELLKAVLARAIVVTPDLEDVLISLRAWALTAALDEDPDEALARSIDFFAALALQCFSTEYAYPVSDVENEALDAIESLLSPGAPLPLLVAYAAYRPLSPFLKHPPEAAAPSHWVAVLYDRMIDAPRRETEIASTIPDLGKAPDDASSEAIRAQYERYPYPRWINAGTGSPTTFEEAVRGRFPGMDLGELPSAPADVLIAGCGTGRQVVQAATHYHDASITAIDLSRASLAYAKRTLLDRGIGTVDFARADILSLGDWDRRFDLIECMGVLHHMADPARGLEIIAGLLRPGGLLRLGLYSERARNNVIAARRFLAERGIEDTTEGIRMTRSLIASLPDEHPAHSIAKSLEFFSLSGLHDYILNAREHQYRPASGSHSLKALIDGAGLSFQGFDPLRPDLAALYHDRFPEDEHALDLDNWDDFEQDHPDAFSGMYQFWCRKPA